MISVYTPNSTPRIVFIFKFIFEEILNISFELTSDKQEFETSIFPRVNYSNERWENTINIKPHSLLCETGIKEQNIQVDNWVAGKIFFQTDSTGDIPFDLFAASFYLLTRYEEYLSFEKDKHGRYPAEASLAFKNNFLEMPVVDQWAYLLADLLKKQYPDFIFPNRKFHYVPTIDIDVAFAYQHKGFLRTTGAFAKALASLDFNDNYRRIMVLMGIEKDPYDTYDIIDQLHESYGFKPIFFFLTGQYGKYDKNHALKKKAYKQLITKIAANTQVGLHPSYRSNDDIKVLKKEVSRFAELLDKKVERSRQHFLKMAIPQTYRKLNKLGIKEDYTMGFASRPGFRAGTCTPFHFYDLEREKQTPLKIYPFQVMDGTLNEYMQLNNKESIVKIKKLINEVKRVNGTFISLWHNQSFSEQHIWKGWSDIYEEMLKICKSK